MLLRDTRAEKFKVWCACIPIPGQPLTFHVTVYCVLVQSHIACCPYLQNDT